MSIEPVYPEFYIYEVKINNVWESLSSDVVKETSCSYGISGQTATDRIASSGRFEFFLNNKSGLYSPYLSSSKSGWTVGLPFRFGVVFECKTYYRFYGRINKLEPDAGETGLPLVKVIVLDWVDLAASQPVQSPQIATNKKLEEAIPLLLNSLSIQPVKTKYYPTTHAFQSVFDQTKDKTKVLTELSRLTLSEFGYAYLTHDNDLETLVVEDRFKRDREKEIKKLPISLSSSSILVAENGEKLITESGSYLKVDELFEAQFIDNYINLTTSYGNKIANSVKVNSYPKKIDTSVSVLYSLSSSMQLKAYESKSNFTCSFRDTAGLAERVAGKNFVTPVATTDYLFNTKSDGTGTDLTSGLAVTASFTSNSVTFSLSNNSSQDGYITKLQVRGIGIYTYESIGYISEDTDSQLNYGYSELSLDQVYQDDSKISSAVGYRLLMQGKTPKQQVETVTVLANSCSYNMEMFLNLNVGDKIFIQEPKTGINAEYFINRIDFSINGKMITFTLYPVEALIFGTSSWVLGSVGQSELGITTYLSYS